MNREDWRVWRESSEKNLFGGRAFAALKPALVVVAERNAIAERRADSRSRKPHGFRYGMPLSIRIVHVCDDFSCSAELQPALGALMIFAARAKAPRYSERPPNFGCGYRVGNCPG
jgi:hypothetical protein